MSGDKNEIIVVPNKRSNKRKTDLLGDDLSNEVTVNIPRTTYSSLETNRNHHGIEVNNLIISKYSNDQEVNSNNSSVPMELEDEPLFDKSKIVIYIDPLHHQNPGIKIHSAQQNFFETFMYSPFFQSFLFDTLVGSLSCVSALRRINNSVLLGRSHLDNVVLYRNDGKPLHCHIAIQCIIGNPNKKALSITPQYPRTYRWAVITIRSLKLVEKSINQVNQNSSHLVVKISNSGNNNN